ncbi:family 16 glycoside hydrolase [Bacteroidota bacterium]
MKKYILLLVISIFIISCNSIKNEDQEEWIKLFNGKNLDGWDIKITGYNLNDNYNNTFRVTNGILSASYDNYDNFNGEFGHIFYNEKFSYYKLRIEYRFVGEQVPGGPGWAFRNSGAMLHSQSAKSMKKDQSFPTSIEFQLLGGNGSDERPTANLCTPGTHYEKNGELIKQHCTNSTSKTFHGDQWVRVEAIVLGDSLITHIVENDTVLIYSKPQLDTNDANYESVLKQYGSNFINEGYISLQGESHPVEFKKVELLNLKGCTDPKAINYKSYFVKSDNSRCIYK